MRIEHVAFQVEHPQAVARWYAEHLGMRIKRAQADGPRMHFLACDGEHVLLEFYNNPAAPLPDYRAMHPLMLHIALVSDDLAADRQRLIAAGAAPFDEITTTPAGDKLAMLRDPWGLSIQLAQRAVPMLPA